MKYMVNSQSIPDRIVSQTVSLLCINHGATGYYTGGSSIDIDLYGAKNLIIRNFQYLGEGNCTTTMTIDSQAISLANGDFVLDNNLIFQASTAPISGQPSKRLMVFDIDIEY